MNSQASEMVIGPLKGTGLDGWTAPLKDSIDVGDQVEAVRLKEEITAPWYHANGSVWVGRANSSMSPREAESRIRHGGRRISACETVVIWTSMAQIEIRSSSSSAYDRTAWPSTGLQAGIEDLFGGNPHAELRQFERPHRGQARVAVYVRPADTRVH